MLIELLCLHSSSDNCLMASWCKLLSWTATRAAYQASVGGRGESWTHNTSDFLPEHRNGPALRVVSLT